MKKKAQLLLLSLLFTAIPFTKIAECHSFKDLSLNSTPLISRLKIQEGLEFCRKEQFDTTIAFFIDMSIHSGKKRFFVYDFQERKILYTGLCCHGAGKGSTCSKPVFSNAKGSNCTSLGKYKIGKRSYSNWGINIHYKMHGLEESNSNAFNRIVVLHSYTPMPAKEIYPEHLPMGWSLGCPVVSDDFIRKLDKLLKTRESQVMMWIYE